MTDEKTPRFEELPPWPPREDGMDTAPNSEKRLLVSFTLQSGRRFHWGFKRYYSPQDGRRRDAIIQRSTSRNRVTGALYQSEETLSITAVDALESAIYLWKRMRRAESVVARTARQPWDGAHVVPVAAPPPPPSGPQPSRLAQRKAEAERRRGGELPASFVAMQEKIGTIPVTTENENELVDDGAKIRADTPGQER
jgi:hypothetical protein